MYKAFPMKNSDKKGPKVCAECGKKSCNCKKPGRGGKSSKKC